MINKILLAIFLYVNIFIAQSQITWSSAMDISASTFSNMLPRMALDRAGNPLVIWGRMSDQSIFFSRWTGSSFTTPVKLNPSSMTVTITSWMGPDIASKGDTVYVVLRQSPESADTSKHTYILRSFDGGVSFAAPVRVDYIKDSMSRFPTVTVDAAGNPIVGFMELNSMYGDAHWVVTKSTDMGNSFTVDKKASGWGSSSSEVCDCCPGAIVSSGNNSAMLYRNNISNIRDIWTGISTDNNVSYSSGFTVDDNNWMIMSCPSSGPDGVIIGDTLYSVFMNGGSMDDLSYLSKSSISGGAVNSVDNLTGSITGLLEQNYPRIADPLSIASVRL